MPVEKVRKGRKDKGIVKGSNSSYPAFWKHGKHQEHFISGRQKLKLPPLDILNFLFRYEPESGKLCKIRESSGKLCEPEREITTLNSNCYLAVGITDSNELQKFFLVHHICFYIHSGIEPLSIVDHINGISTDNRFSNLRLATESLNNRNRGMSSNNTSGVTGVTWNKGARKWKAQIRDITGKKKYLGYYLDKEIAARVVSEHYANPVNGFTERHGL